MLGKPGVEGIDPAMLTKEDKKKVMGAVKFIKENMYNKIKGRTFSN